ncbi:phosphotriesterase [Amycolatopsis roodepoortensis]|uniref:Phosphotriesterase-related protein n=1 Tax=Amycolatopsis roodepoortensis TaxID=700274 RepID=A0ABR9LBN9_9PSEU|nr:phosphotriesterase [Amycolatopsis roodepoortensis]MBE1578103.1 phosphotriesterase-related protein [Amycolatopsis roodepoortensis]
MAQVETVRGPVDTAELGKVLMHEHLFVLSPEFMANHPEHDGFREDEHVADAIRRLDELKAAGIDTIVDPTVIGLGRYIPRVRRVAAETELRIIVATGLYTYNDVPHYLHHRGPGLIFDDGADPLVGLFTGDIVDGIADTGVKAALLKCATDEPGVTPGVERVLRAVAKAHRETGAPIMTHTHAPTRRGLEQQAVFATEGVDLSRVLIGHSGDSTDLDYLTGIADKGSLLGMDRFGLDPLLSFEERVATVVAMCERGYAGSMVLSHDASCFIDWFEQDKMAAVAPNWHFLHITRDVLPALRERGVSERDITTMLVDNPRRFFEHTGAY